jgi:hypothetical protein
MNNENFDNLWSSLKDQVRKARTSEKSVYTFGETATTQVYGGRISVSDPDVSENEAHATLHTARGSWGGIMYVNQDDLLKIAARCMAVAEQMEASKKFNADAHGHLLAP